MSTLVDLSSLVAALRERKLGSQEVDPSLFETVQEYQWLTDARSGELVEYYKVIRSMIENFNNMLLTTSLRGGALLVALIGAAAYVPTTDTQAGPAILFTVVVLLGAFLIARNLEGQTIFFSRLLRQSIRIADKLEVLVLSVRADSGQIRIPHDLLLTQRLRREYPGRIYVQRRLRFFTFLKWAILVYLLGVAGYILVTQGDFILVWFGSLLPE